MIAIGLIASFAGLVAVSDRHPAMAQESVTLTHEHIGRVKSGKKAGMTARTKSGKNKAAQAAEAQKYSAQQDSSAKLEKDGTTRIREYDRNRRLNR
jgi:hypothetical protein